MLAAAAVAVLGMGVYLFIQVRATPAQAGATSSGRPSTQKPERVTQVATAETKQPVEAPAPPVPGSTRTTWERIAKGDTPALAASTESDDRKVDLKVDNLMELANKAYDTQDFDQAVAIAGKLLSREPNNVRMLRIMVSANCIQGDSAIAQQHYEKLPQFDREQMKQRCDRYGVVFKDPP